MKNDFSSDGVSIIFARPIGGHREHKFNDGKKLANYVWANKPVLFTEIPKSEQRD